MVALWTLTGYKNEYWELKLGKKFLEDKEVFLVYSFITIGSQYFKSKTIEMFTNLFLIWS